MSAVADKKLRAEELAFLESTRRGEDNADKPGPEIVIKPGMVPAFCRDLAQAFADGNAPIYRRGTLLMRAMRIDTAQVIAGVRRPRNALILIRATPYTLMNDAANYATITKWNEKKKGKVNADIPEKYAKTFIAAAPELMVLPAITGICEAPIMRDDGSLLTTSGYDAETGLIFDSQGINWSTLKVSASPTIEDAKSALAILWKPLQDFPFVEKVDRAVAFSAMVSALLRPRLPTTPLHGFTAYAAGSGKTLLTNIVGIIATGRPVAAMAQGSKNEEFEKRVDAVILAADPIANIDNVSRPIQGDAACISLTSSMVRIRRLGTSDRLDVPSTTFWMATGNNLVFKGDVVRRVLLCRIDAGQERPDLRDNFHIKALLPWVLDHRIELLAAIYTILRAYIVAGSPETGCPPLGGFEDWCRRVRDPLVWAGAPDPVESSETVREEDPIAEERGAIYRAWRTLYGDDEKQLKDVTALAQRAGDKDSSATTAEHELVDAFAAISRSGKYDPQAAAYWMRANKGHVREWLRLLDKPGRAGSKNWCVQDMKQNS